MSQITFPGSFSLELSLRWKIKKNCKVLENSSVHRQDSTSLNWHTKKMMFCINFTKQRGRSLFNIIVSMMPSMHGMNINLYTKK